MEPSFTLAAAALLAHWVVLRSFDGRPWSAVWLGRDAFNSRVLTAGTLYGILAIGIPSALLLASHELTVVTGPAGSSARVVGLGVLTFIPAAFFEELMVRGYIFTVVREKFGWRWALIGTSIVFGLVHLGNPGVDAEAIALVILAGFFLGAVLLATKSLYATTMTHFAWNWTMASVMHASVSGVNFPAPDYRIIDSGPDWLTGGRWGPEGGVAAAAGMLVVFLYLYARRLRRMESLNA